MFLILLSMISRYIATFCDLKKKVLCILTSFLSFRCLQPELDLKTEEDYCKYRLRLNEL